MVRYQEDLFLIKDFARADLGKSLDRRWSSDVVAQDQINLARDQLANFNFLKKTKAGKGIIYRSDPGAQYKMVYNWDVSKIEPQVSFPHLPSNTRPVSKCKSVKINQSVIGSCTNGRIEDMRVAAKVLKGKRIHKDLRCIILPGTQEISMQMIREGLTETFIKAGAVVSTPTCGPCLGGHMGILAEGERSIATTNRNFVGRMGHPKSEVYLSNVAVAAASAIAGRIVSPQDL